MGYDDIIDEWHDVDQAEITAQKNAIEDENEGEFLAMVEKVYGNSQNKNPLDRRDDGN